MENSTQGIGMVNRSSLKRKQSDFYDNEPTPGKVALLEEFINQEEEESDDEPRRQNKSIKLLLTPPYFKYIHERRNNLTVRCYSCGDLQTFSWNSKALLTNHLKQEHPNIYETYQKYRCRSVPRSLQKEALNDVETPLIEVNKEFISTPTIEVKQKPIPKPSIEIMEDIPTTSIEVNKDDITISSKQDCYLPPYVKALFEPPYFQIIKQAANGIRFTVRCCTCGKELTSSYTYFSYLKTHLQYNHPDLCKKYEEIKMKQYFPNRRDPIFFDSTAEDKSVESESQVKDVEKVNKDSSEALNFDLLHHIEMPGRMLFEPPYFRITGKLGNGARLGLRCCTCDTYLTTSFTGAPYLKKHMLQCNPDLCKIYDRWKKLYIHKDSNEALNFDLSPHIGMPGRMLFQLPYFRIIRKPDDIERLALRCCTCGKFLTTSFTGASYLKKHMIKCNPNLCQIYDRCRWKHPPNASVKFIYSDEKDLANTTKTHTANALTGKANTNVNETSQEIKNTDESQQQRCSSNAKNTLELSNKTWKVLETLIDQRLNALVKETGYFELESKINKLMEDNIVKGKSMACELKSDIENIKIGCQSVGLAVKQSQAKEIKLQNEIERLNSLLKERKLIIRNIRITNKKKPLKDVENLLKNKLNLSELEIANCSIIPKPKTSNGTSNTECVLIELLSPEDCRLVLSQVETFKNIGISIKPVLSPLLRKNRNKLMVLRKELLRRKSELKVSVRDATLLVNGKHFYWDDVKGLCHDLTLPEAVDLCGVEYLQSLTGLDLREFLNILRNYDIKLK